MGRRVLNRKEMRADFDEAERRQVDTPEAEGEVEEKDDDDEEDEEDEEDGEAEDEGGEDDEAVATKKKKPAKPKAAAKPKAKAKPRTRTAKVTRMRVVWGVYNNSNQLLTTYEYPKRGDAEAHAAKLTADKKSTHFVQPVKEPIEEKKEK